MVGAGFGGLIAARALAKTPGLRITLVDRHNYHTFQPLLYQVATAGLAPDSIAYPVRGAIRRHPGVDFRLASVVGVDLDERCVELGDGARLGYAFLVLATGAVTNSFGVPGVDEHCFGLKSLTDAVRLRSHLIEQLELADELGGTPDEELMTVVVVGGGATGVELCGALAELRLVLAEDHPKLDFARFRVVLLEAADRLVGAFHPSSARSALLSLDRRGIEVRLGESVECVGEGFVRLKSGATIRSRTIVWTAGVRPEPMAAGLGLEHDRAGRVVVGADLSVPGRPEVFAIGDAAACPDGKGGALPQLAPVAMQQARHVARQVARRIEGAEGRPFRYVNKGTMATIGRNAAIAELPGGIRFGGFPAWMAWLGLHLVFLIGFRNRASVLVDWAWSYLTHQRVPRLILPVREER